MIDRKQSLRSSFYLREAYEQATVAHYTFDEDGFRVHSDTSVENLKKAAKILGFDISLSPSWVERDPADDRSIGLKLADVEGRIVDDRISFNLDNLDADPGPHE